MSVTVLKISVRRAGSAQKTQWAIRELQRMNKLIAEGRIAEALGGTRTFRGLPKATSYGPNGERIWTY